MPATMPLHFEVRQVLGLNQRQTAELLGISKRTVQRWDAGRSYPYSHDYTGLAKAAFPVDQALAARLAAKGGTTLGALGLAVAPPAAGAAATGSAPPIEYVIDSVLCAAAVAVDMKPPEIRPALVAAFRRVRQLGLSVEAVERALAGDDPKAAKAKK